jgi:hypothetical protein
MTTLVLVIVGAFVVALAIFPRLIGRHPMRPATWE